MNRNLFILLSSVACATGALASDDVTTARFPDADTVEVDSLVDIVYRADGTSTERDESWTKILTERGRRGERVQRLDYSRRMGTARFVSIGIVGTNGVERPVDFAASLKDTTDNSSVSANIYDPQDRKLVCAVPELAVGETLHVVAEQVITSPRVKDAWSDFELLESTQPILKRTIRITAPAARPLKKIAVRHPLGNVAYRTEPGADGATVHIWCATNVPQAFPEPNMPPFYNEVQGLRVSTFAAWPELSHWYWELCRPHLESTNAAMVAKVHELVSAAREDTRRTDAPRCASVSGARLPRCASVSDARIRALFKFVSQEVRYMGLTLEDTSPGYEPHDVSLTFDNRYGVCRDKAALLVALLRIAGYDAYPVLINAGGKSDPEVPTTMFNHAIVAVREGGGWSLMDPTDESSRDLFPSYLADCTYLVAHPKGETLLLSPVTPPEKNCLGVRVDGTLESDGSAFVTAKIDFGGMNDTIFRHALLRKKPKERRRLFERLADACVPGAEVLGLEILPADLRDTDSPLAAQLSLRLPDLVLVGETCNELTVPFLSPNMGLANWLFEGRTSLEHRRFPLELSSTAAIDERVTLKLDEKLGVPVTLPNEPAITGKYAFVRAFAVTNGVLSAHRTLAVSSVSFPTNDYLALREDLKRVEARERVRPRFAPNRLAEADVRTRLSQTEVDLDGPDAWTVTNTVVKEILTYDGKKKNAELKLGFHPSWKTVEVLSAVVSNRDGTVSRLTPKEMNVLDCGWAASAPRYPAGKTLVVTLPRVEIGSVISTVIATTVTNAPASYYATFGFDTMEPTDRIDVRVNGWRRAVDRPKRIPSEPRTPASALWRDLVTISSNDWSRTAAILRRAAEVGVVSAAREDTRRTDAPRCASVSDAPLRAIRDWMAKNVRIAGPSLYEVPIDQQLTAPETVLAERYGTRLDYVRTLCALLRGAGYEADVVFAAGDADDDPVLSRRDREEYPNVRAYAQALCRVRERTGGFLGFGGEEHVLFIGTENEYAELGATGFEGSHYFDPVTEAFGVVTVPEPRLKSWARDTMRIILRENGAADFEIGHEIWGAGVGAFRKSYSEMLPEIRDRHHQALLGAIADAASATGELVTDVTGYPARRTFSCYVPDFAVVKDGVMTVTLAPFLDGVVAFTGSVRRNPIALPAGDPCETEIELVFPEGYAEVEHLPATLRTHSPLDPAESWSELAVRTERRDGQLVVRLTSRAFRHAAGTVARDYFPLFRDWARTGEARANRTVVVRR